MSKPRKALAACALAGLLLPPAALLGLWAEPPELIRVAANYAAKSVCSNVFIAKRDPSEVLALDVQAPGHPILKLMRVTVDRTTGVVRAGLFGFIGGGLAVARSNVGCAAMPDGRLDAAHADVGPAPATGPEPLRRDLIVTVPALQDVVANDELAGPGMRAIVVVNHGRIVAERYGRGFGPATPQLGWSMTKSVTAGLIGLLVKDGRLALDQPAGVGRAARARSTIADLMSMTSGLEFNESYGTVSDVTRMLYLEPDMAGFAASKPSIHPPGETWSYSSGTAVMLARIFQDAAGPDAISYVRQRLFAPLGMLSAVMETDEQGTLVGSSYMYATPRDWARYGQLLAQDGLWQGQEILPPGYVAMMSSPVAASGGDYGHGMVWCRLNHDDAPPAGPDPLPADAFWMSGHDGQYAAIVPSRQLVVVRMGLTPEHDHYRPEPLVLAVLRAVR